MEDSVRDGPSSHLSLPPVAACKCQKENVASGEPVYHAKQVAAKWK